MWCRDGVQELVEKYIEKNYKKESSRVSLCFNQAGHLQIDISCINLRLKEFWTGEWQSKWSIDITNQKLYGMIKINNHYWEQGNIQFHLAKKYEDIALTSADAPVIIDTIDKLETEYQTVVEETLEFSKEDIFKKMRRVLPISGQKFDWASTKNKMQ